MIMISIIVLQNSKTKNVKQKNNIAITWINIAWGFSWLNIASKCVLIKSVLNSLPLFQFSILAPSRILRKMEEIIRKFFWKGAKQNEKMFSLVSCDSISKPLLEGGLNLKKLGVKNITMGAKLIWRIIALNPSWAHLALWKKYLWANFPAV